MLNLTDIDRRQMRQLQRTEKNKSLYVRLTVLLMFDDGFSVQQIETSLGIDQTTINRYLRLYQSSGLKVYLTLNYQGYSGKLTAQEESILDQELQDFLYINTHEVIVFIEKKFNKRYTPSGVSALLGRLGFSYKKTKHEPCKANVATQVTFLTEMMSLLSDVKADQGDSVAYFVDAVHPQHNTRADYGWIKKGQDFPVLANTGRKRLNINAALNAHDVTDMVIDEAQTIATESTKRLIEKIVFKNPFKDIFLIHDNASYYYAKELKDWLATTYPSVKQVFLPPYSPNLNLIERLWRFLRKEIISYHFYPTFKEFKKIVLDFFDKIEQHKSALTTLLTLKFRIHTMSS